MISVGNVYRLADLGWPSWFLYTYGVDETKEQLVGYRSYSERHKIQPRTQQVKRGNRGTWARTQGIPSKDETGMIWENS
jgi:hypothetical protein